MKKIFFLFLLFGVNTGLLAQAINGMVNPSITTTYEYTVNTGTTIITNPIWEISGGGTIQSPSTINNYNAKCFIKWNTAGTYTVTFKNGSTTIATRVVTVACAPPVVSLTSASFIRHKGKATMLAELPDSYNGTYSFRWYAAATGGTALGSGAVFTTPEITVTTSYYVAAYEPVSGCESARVQVVANVYPLLSPNRTTTEVVRVKNVKTDLDLIALTEADQKRTVISHYDGLMRIIQQISMKATPSGKDMVQPVEYDPLGRASKSYLPYVATSDGEFQNQYETSQAAFYNNSSDNIADDAKPYATSVYEKSPVGRILKQGNVGDGFQPNQGHDQRVQYFFNDANEVRKLNSDGSSTTYWAVNTLFKIKSIDAEGNHVITYTDASGQTVLQKQQLDETIGGVMVNYLETYYVYDDFGRIRYIISPKGVKELAANGWTLSAFNNIRDVYVYQFVYDYRGRVMEKKVPGQAWMYYIYDDLNRLVLTQDGLLRAQKKWLFVKYDYKGRVVMSGLYLNANDTTRSTVQAIADGLYKSSNLTFGVSAWYESKATILHGYSNTSFPKTNQNNSALEILSVNYFDTHDFDYNGSNDYAYTDQFTVGTDGVDDNTVGRTRGKATGSKRLILGSTNWLYSYIFYDEYGRAIQVRSNNHLNPATVDNLSTGVYLFDGTLAASKMYHNAGSGRITTVLSKYEYDTQGRVAKIKQSNNGGALQTVAKYTYNELGQLVDKKLHETTTDNYLQSVDFRYTIRGQLKSINNAQLTNDGNTSNDDTGDYFGMELLRQNTESGLNNSTLYNGNISAVKWKGIGAATGSAEQKSYKFAYDKTNKLDTATWQVKGASAWDKEVGVHNESMAYDHNGNILKLTRHQNQRGFAIVNNIPTETSTPQLMDDLTYTHTTGNQLSKVEDASADDKGFKNGSNTTDEYMYDINGNLLKDKNKGITNIVYSFLGKPTQISFGSTKTINYTYDASGSKLSMSVTADSVTTTTDYAGGFVYENGTLSFFGSPEGRVVNKSGTLERQYSIADHQGNTRVVFTSAPPAATTSTTNFESSTNTNFQNYTNRINFELMDKTDFSGSTYSYSQKLTGGNNSQIGVAKSVKVYPGDKVKIEAYAKYYNPQSTSSNLSGFGLALTSAFGVTSSSTGEALKAYNSLNNYAGVIASGGGGGSTSHPKVFVNILLFDKDFNFLDEAWEQIDGGEQVGATPKAAHDYMSKEVTVKEAGYAYVYISNESPTLVEFYVDDVAVTHTPSNVLQYNEYYPFGLQTATSWTRDNNTNSFMYNAGSELNKDNGWYETFFRGYDPAIGRFLQVDPLSVSEQATYQYAGNNPVLFNDPWGLNQNSGGEEKGNKPPHVEYDKNHDGYPDWLQRRYAFWENIMGPWSLNGTGGGGGPAHFTDFGHQLLAKEEYEKAHPGEDPLAYNPTTGQFGYWEDDDTQLPLGSEAGVIGKRSVWVSVATSTPFNSLGLAMTVVGSGFAVPVSQYRTLLKEFTKSAINTSSVTSKVLGGAGLALTAGQLYFKYTSGQAITTNDKIDFGVNMTLGVVGLMALNPVGLVVVAGLGVSYGIYTLYRDNGK